ncbi:MAG: hypothetical protein ABI689_16080 [Thermoanaerobaculia bacterium]
MLARACGWAMVESTVPGAPVVGVGLDLFDGAGCAGGIGKCRIVVLFAPSTALWMFSVNEAASASCRFTMR